jgi:hypothetical protein
MMRREFIYHSHPLRIDLGEYEWLIDRICGDSLNAPRVPRSTKEYARQIIKLVQTYYPTRGRRRIAIIVAALGIARGSTNVSDLKDLLFRAKLLTGEDIPPGQIQNTFKDLRKFLELLPLYRSKCGAKRDCYFKLTSEERRVLRALKGRTLVRELFSRCESNSPP